MVQLLRARSRMLAALATLSVVLSGCETPETPRLPDEWHSEPEGEDYERRTASIVEFLATNDTPLPPARPLPVPGGRDVTSPAPLWKSIGPQPTTFDTYQGVQRWSGRINAIAIDPTDQNIMYVGSDSGGIWKSSDAGVTWTPKSVPHFVTTLTIDPTTPTTIYAGTGRAFGSVGILKSTDAGETWETSQVHFAMDRRVTSIAIRPGRPSELLAAMRFYGIYRSTDAGLSWTRVLEISTSGFDGWAWVAFHPTQDVAFAALGPPDSGSAPGGLFKSTDGGVTWDPLAGGLPTPLGEVWIALAPSDANTLYAVFADAGTQRAQGLYRSSDGGATWVQRTVPVSNSRDYCFGSCSYNNVIAVHPTNADAVYLGGYSLWVSTNGASSWVNFNGNSSGPLMYLHIDQHALAFRSDGRRLYAGGDGGLWMTELDPANLANRFWTHLNSTLSISQFYSISINPRDVTMSLGGTQDNNTQLYYGGQSWIALTCGDGNATAIVGTSPATYLTTCYVPAATATVELRRSTDLVNWSDVNVGIGERRAFVPPLVADTIVADTGQFAGRVYTAAQRVYRSDDAGATWSAISDVLADGTSTITAIGLVRGVTPQVVVGTSTGKVWEQSGTATWINRSAGLPAGFVSSIVVSRQRPQKIYVCLGSWIYATELGTTNWTKLAYGCGKLALFDSLQFTVGSRTVGSLADGRIVSGRLPRGQRERSGVPRPLGRSSRGNLGKRGLGSTGRYCRSRNPCATTTP
jgi:hypothetical protein